MATVWVNDWTQPISVNTADALESKDALESNDSYALFSGLDNIPTDVGDNVYIGIYQVVGGDSVYAIASKNKAKEQEDEIKVEEDGATPNQLY